MTLIFNKSFTSKWPLPLLTKYCTVSFVQELSVQISNYKNYTCYKCNKLWTVIYHFQLMFHGSWFMWKHSRLHVMNSSVLVGLSRSQVITMLFWVIFSIQDTLKWITCTVKYHYLLSYLVHSHTGNA